MFRSTYQKLWIFHSRRTPPLHFLHLCSRDSLVISKRKNDHETVSPRRSEWQNTTNEAPRKMSKGNYERYKFLTSVYFSFIRFERGESIVKSETNTRPFLLTTRPPPSLPRNDLKTFHLSTTVFFFGIIHKKGKKENEKKKKDKYRKDTRRGWRIKLWANFTCAFCDKKMVRNERERREIIWI